MEKIYYELLKTWCDALLKLQVKGIKVKSIYGGIICPACGMVHGRATDAIYPMLYMAQKTGRDRYLEAAILLQDWLDNVTSADGAFTSELSSNVNWKGCTIFSIVALAEAIRHHGALLNKKELGKWTARLRAYTQYVYNNHTMETGDTNYPITTSLAMTLAGEVLGEPKYNARGREFAGKSLAFFTKENKLILGEGGPRPMTGVSPRGCRAVDLGYNVEESLPAFAMYGALTGDKEVLDIVTESLKNHLEFMLPDGAWDNSWGSRNYKWTYWGSRTSDGCQPAFLFLADRDPGFAEAALRNTKLLKECTHDGILHGGPHLKQHGFPPCVHHTFCHAKGLATALNYLAGRKIRHAGRAIPRETASGIREFREILTWLAAIGPWRATITACDWKNIPDGNATGGALSMLWHEYAGPVLAASMGEYTIPEPTSMQKQNDPDSMPLTPRLEIKAGDRYFRSINDMKAQVKPVQEKDRMTLEVNGELVDWYQYAPEKGKIKFKTSYIFTENAVEINTSLDTQSNIDGINYVLPVISIHTEKVRIATGGRCVEIKKSKGILKITSNLPAKVYGGGNKRVFNLVPGFEAVPLIFNLNAEKGKQLQVKISFSSKRGK